MINRRGCDLAPPYRLAPTMTTQSELRSPSSPVERLLLSVEQAAEVLSIKRTKMYELVGAGKVESVMIGKLRRIPTSALADYVTRLRAAAHEPSPAMAA